MRHLLLSRVFRVLTGVVVGLAVAYWTLRPMLGNETSGSDGYFLATSMKAPDFTLTSQDGRRITPEDFPGKLLAVFFGYTSCPDVCPLTLSNLSRALEETEGSTDRIQVLFVTVDPERDTPERMAAYLRTFDPSFLGLTGTEDEIRSVASEFGVFFARHGDGESYTVDHTARVFVIDPQGRIPLTFPSDATPEGMAQAFSRLLKESS